MINDQWWYNMHNIREKVNIEFSYWNAGKVRGMYPKLGSVVGPQIQWVCEQKSDAFSNFFDDHDPDENGDHDAEDDEDNDNSPDDNDNDNDDEDNKEKDNDDDNVFDDDDVDDVNDVDKVDAPPLPGYFPVPWHLPPLSPFLPGGWGSH